MPQAITGSEGARPSQSPHSVSSASRKRPSAIVATPAADSRRATMPSAPISQARSALDPQSTPISDAES